MPDCTEAYIVKGDLLLFMLLLSSVLASLSQCTTVKEAQCFKKPYVFEEVRLLEVLQMDACGGLLLNLFSSNAFCHPARRPEASQH